MSQTQSTMPAAPAEARTLHHIEISAALVARRFADTLTPPLADAIAKTKAQARAAGSMALATARTEDEINEARNVAHTACLLLLLDNKNSAASHIRRRTKMPQTSACRLLDKVRADMNADADLLDITIPLRAPGARHWETVAALAYEQTAEVRAMAVDGTEYNAAIKRREFERRFGVDAYTTGYREEQIARMAEDACPLRADAEDQTAAFGADARNAIATAAPYYTRSHYDPRGMTPTQDTDPVARFTNRAIFLSARTRFKTLVDTFKPEPTGYTQTGRPIPPTADEREDQYEAHRDSCAAPAVVFSESLRTALDWTTLYGPITPRKARRPRPAPTPEELGARVDADAYADALAKRNAPTVPAFGEQDRADADAQDRADALNRARQSGRNSFDA